MFNAYSLGVCGGCQYQVPEYVKNTIARTFIMSVLLSPDWITWAWRWAEDVLGRGKMSCVWQAALPLSPCAACPFALLGRL